jgi:hypothetical protein
MGCSCHGRCARPVTSAATTILVLGGDGLGVVALHVAVLDLHDLAVGVRGVRLRLGRRRRGAWVCDRAASARWPAPWLPARPDAAREPPAPARWRTAPGVPSPRAVARAVRPLAHRPRTRGSSLASTSAASASIAATWSSMWLLLRLAANAAGQPILVPPPRQPDLDHPGLRAQPQRLGEHRGQCLLGAVLGPQVILSPDRGADPTALATTAGLPPPTWRPACKP